MYSFSANQTRVIFLQCTTPFLSCCCFFFPVFFCLFVKIVSREIRNPSVRLLRQYLAQFLSFSILLLRKHLVHCLFPQLYVCYVSISRGFVPRLLVCYASVSHTVSFLSCLFVCFLRQYLVNCFFSFIMDCFVPARNGKRRTSYKRDRPKKFGDIGFRPPYKRNYSIIVSLN